MNKIFILVLVALIAIGTPSCKTTKNTGKKQPKSTVDPKVTNAKASLRDLLDDNTTSLEEREKELARIKSMNITDPEVLNLIKQIENKLKQERDIVEKKKLEEIKKKEEVKKKEFTMSEYFDLISKAPNANDANQKIQEALKLCADPNAPLLIIIAKDGADVDYDEPTTIEKYLNYLKDVKKNPNKIENLKFDSNNKITEVELIKK